MEGADMEVAAIAVAIAAATAAAIAAATAVAVAVRRKTPRKTSVTSARCVGSGLVTAMNAPTTEIADVTVNEIVTIEETVGRGSADEDML